MPTSDYFPIALPGLITYIQAHEPSNWASYFIGRVGSLEGLIDCESPDLTELSREDSFANNPVAYFGALTVSTAPSSALYMVVTTLGRLQFIHHLTQIWSRDGSPSFYDLSGFRSAASPVIVPQEAFILPPAVNGLPVAHILKRMSFLTDGVSDDDFLHYSYRLLVPLPQFVSSFLLGTRMLIRILRYRLLMFCGHWSPPKILWVLLFLSIVTQYLIGTLNPSIWSCSWSLQIPR